jgi:hypothetical protein
MTILPNGIGAASGVSLVTSGVLFTSGDIYYVSSVLGDDANSGKSDKDPKATFSSAYAASSAGDMMVLMTNHAETLTAAITISKRLTIVGCGQLSGLPTVKFTNNQAAGQLFTITTTGVEFRSIWFEEDAQANSAVKISTNQARTYFEDCYFQIDGNSNAACVQVNTGASDSCFRNCTFVSTSLAQDDPTNNDPPTTAVEITAVMNGMRLQGCVFDGGQVGFSDYALKGTAGAITNFRALDISLLRGADIAVTSSSTGYIHVTTSTGSTRVEGIQ